MIASVNFNVNPNPETTTPSALGENDLNARQPLTPQPSRQAKIDWLLALGLSPLPVAPAQDAQTYPARDKKGAIIRDADGNPKPQFTGKNPSYLDANDTPHALSHKTYQDRQPTKEELDTWFANPLNGVGSLGSDEWVFIDLDRPKFDVPGLNADENQALCNEAGKTIIDAIVAQTQKLPPYERTQSYGWRMVVGLSSPPTFTNFAMTPGGDHVGEILGKGRFAVLAPSVGPTGNAYEAYHRCAPEEIPIVDTLEQLTFVPVKASRGRPKKTTSTLTQPPLTPLSDSSTPTSNPSTQSVNTSAPKTVTSSATSTLEKYPQLREKVFELRDLGTDKTRNVLAGINDKGDRSHSLTTAIKDWYGWERWCKLNGIAYRGDTRSLAIEAGINLKLEDAEDRVDRILAGIDGDSCLTSCEFKGNSDEGCWKRILKLAGVRGSKFNANANANAKVIPLPTATPLPKAVGGNDNSPPLPPNYGGGHGGSNPNDDVDWSAPVNHKGQLGYWAKIKGSDDYKFEAKCNFDFTIDRYFIRHKNDQGKTSTPDGGGFRLKVTFAEDATSDYVYLTAQDFGKADKFAEALKAGLGQGVSFRLSTYELQALRQVKVKEYRKRGGKKYRLCDRVGQQVDGTWVFPDVQFDANGNRLDPEKTKWVFNPYIGGDDHIPCPLIPYDDNPNALRNLLIAQREFAGVEGFMAFWLTTGFVAASVHDQRIVNEEGFFPILNLCGDFGGGKTVNGQSATSLLWGIKNSGLVASISLSMAYERLSKLGSVVSALDDPPNQSEPEKRQLDEFIKSLYNRFPRQVRKNNQEPHSALIITSNDAKGATSDATKSRLIRLYIAVKERDGQAKAYANLRKAMAEAPGAFRSLLTIGYDAEAVLEVRQRLQKHMKGAPGRSVNNLALLTWYTKRVVELAGIDDIDVEAWVIANLCPQMVEEMGSVNSATDFVKRLLTLQAESYVGDWNFTTVTHRSLGLCKALNMPSLWKLTEKTTPTPTYDRSVLEKVLVDLGCVKNQQAKFDSDKDSTLTYQREIRKGRNQGENWVEPTPPKKVNRGALLIPHRLWETLGFEPPDPEPMSPTPSDSNSKEWDAWDTWGDDSGESSEPSSRVEKSSEGHTTRSNVDAQSVSDLSLSQSSQVVKKIERESDEKVVELNPSDATKKIQDATDAQNQNEGDKSSAASSENLTTSLLAPNETPETPNPQAVDEVGKAFYFEPTSGEKYTTLAETNAQTCDDNLIKLGEIATEMIHCASQADVENLYAAHSTEAIEAAKEILGDEERLTFEAIVSQCASNSPAVAQEVQLPAVTPKLENPTPNATTTKDASPTTTVGTRFRYVGVLTHNLKDAEGNLILDAAGKPVVLKKGSDIFLKDVGGAINREYVNVCAVSFDCLPLGIHRSQLEEVNAHD